MGLQSKKNAEIFRGTLTLLLTIEPNFVKLPYLKVTFLKASYLSVLGLCRHITYRPDELIFFADFASPQGAQHLVKISWSHTQYFRGRYHITPIYL